MTFRGDDRAVSTVVGAVLIFGILILALGVYQAQIVPTENEGVEYRHSQSVQNQMQDLRNSLVGTAQTGDGSPVSVKLGTRYPLRTFAVNPPPVYGTLESVPLSQASKVTISNVEATNVETDDFLSGTLTFDTKGLAYNGNYNEFRSGPNAVRYEHGALYNDYEAGDINLTAGLLIDGNDITVVTLNASDAFSESGIESVSVDPKPLSAPHHATEIENSGGTLTLELPTNASRRYWVDTYEGRPNVADVSLSETPSGNVTTIEFSDGTYNLRMAAVGVGDGLEKPEPKYLTLVENRTDQLVVEARDRYNNPINTTVSTSGPFTDTEIETGENGRATFTVKPGTTPTDTTLTILDNSEAAERVEAKVSAGSGSTSPTTPSNNPFNVFWDTDATNASAITCYDANTTCVARNDQVDLVAAVDPAESGVPLEFETNDTGVSGASTTSRRTDGSGQATMALDASSLSTAESIRGIDAYVSAVGNGDRTRVVFPVGGGVYYRYYEGSYGGESNPPSFGSAVDSGTADNFMLGASSNERGDGFGYNYTAYIDIPQDGTYTFYTSSDDGSWLSIDGQQIVNNGGDHSPNEESGTVTLNAGRHNITVEYYENSGGQELTVSWAGPGFTKEEIPSNVLTPRVVSDSGGNSPPTTQNDIRYDGNLGTTGSSSAIQFDITNIGSQWARINAVNVTSNVGNAGRIWRTGNPGQFGYEIHITGGQSDGYVEAGNPQNFKPKDGAFYADGRQISLSSNGVLSTSSGTNAATVNIGEFGSANGNNFNQYDFTGLTKVASSDPWDMRITLKFQNRGDVTYYFQEN